MKDNDELKESKTEHQVSWLWRPLEFLAQREDKWARSGWSNKGYRNSSWQILIPATLKHDG